MSYRGLTFLCFVAVLATAIQAQTESDIAVAAAPFQLHGAASVDSSAAPTDELNTGKTRTRKELLSPPLDGPIDKPPDPTDDVAASGDDLVTSLPTQAGADGVADSSTSTSSQEPYADDASQYAMPAAIPVPDEQVATFPTSPMGTVASGAEAVARLGTDIAAVAQAYGKEAEQLARTFLSDADLLVDEGNKLLYK